MAPVLQCPECGTKHPLDGIGDRSAFPCNGCGRILKVPDQARTAVGAAAPAPPAAPAQPPAAAAPDEPFDQDETHVAPRPLVAPVPSPAMAATPAAAPGPLLPPVAPEPVAPEPSASASVPGARGRVYDPVPPRYMRFALWLVAVPLGFLIVFVGARLVGVLSSAQVEDVYFASGWGRFLPIARLLPVVALVIAGLVHGSVVGLTRWRHQRHAAPAPAAARPPAPAQPAARPSRRTGS